MTKSQIPITLQNQDPELFSILKDETHRQKNGIELIASENFTSNSVLECLGSVFTNKYSEGLPGKRYYGGNEHIDRLENLCIKRALKAFRLNDNEWGCNVQPYSGSVANLAVYLALLKPGDTIMGLELSSGGHLTHGFYTPKKKITASSTYYNSVPYKVNEYGFIDYLKLEQLADEHKPNLIICGASAYSRDFDYETFRRIANKHNSYLMADIAHISGFVATGEMNNPFEYCDIVTTTTHKTLRGPRAGMIFFKKSLEQQINDAVFPGLQGGPHQNQIAGIACQLNEVMTPEFKKYIQQVRLNAQAMCEEFRNRNYDIVTGGTDNHLFLLNLKNKNISGSRAEKILEYVGIYINKNTVPGDVSALNPSGIRIGTPAMTTKGIKEEDMKKIAELIDETLMIAVELQNQHEPKTLKEFTELLGTQSKLSCNLEEIKNKINEFLNYKI
jgi:glycine hydroxymethyltransferase